MHKKTGIYLGEMIVEAHKLEVAQNWVGVAFAPSATWPLFMAEASPSQIIKFGVPVKEGKEPLLSPIALDWPRRWRDTETSSLQERLEKLRALAPVKFHLYYDHAISFANWSEQHHDWHKRPDEENSFQHLRMRPESEISQSA